MQENHSTSELVRTWWHPGLEDDFSDIEGGTTSSAYDSGDVGDDEESDGGLGLNLDLELLSAKCAAVMPLEILYRSVRDSYQNRSGRRVDNSNPRRQRPLSAPAFLPSTTPSPPITLLEPPRESSENSFADNITDIIESMLDQALTSESPVLKGLSGKPLGVEDALVAVNRGDYSTDTMEEDYLPNRLKFPLRLPLKAITEEQEDTSPLKKKQQSSNAEETNAFISELEDTSINKKRESGSSALSSDPMDMFNYDYYDPLDWYDTQPLLNRPHKNAETVSMVSSPTTSSQQAPVRYSLFPRPPPNKPLPTLPPGFSSQTRQLGNAIPSATTVSSNSSLQLLQTKLHNESLKHESENSEKLRPNPLSSSNYTVLEPGSVYDPISKQEPEKYPEANIHPLFRKGAQVHQENSQPSSLSRSKPPSKSVWSGTKLRRGMSDVSDRSMLSASMPHSKPPSAYLCSPALSSGAASVVESDPFASSNNERSCSPLRLSSGSAESAAYARATSNKSASLKRATSLMVPSSHERPSSQLSRASLNRSASFATRASRKSGLTVDKDDSSSDLITFEDGTPMKKKVGVMTRPSFGQRASHKSCNSVPNYGSFAECLPPDKRPPIERLISLGSTASSASEARRSMSVRTTGPHAPYILHESLPQRRPSIDCMKEYAQAIDDIHGQERVRPFDTLNENFVDIPKEQFRVVPSGTTSPAVSQLSLRSTAARPWPMKRKSSSLRRVTNPVVAPAAGAGRESYSNTLTSGVTRSASVSVPTIADPEFFDTDGLYVDPMDVGKRSGRVAELVALRAQEDQQAEALRELKAQREKEGKMAKLMRKAQSLEKVGEGFKRLFSGSSKKDAAKIAGP
ncbi:hypothetical protein MMC34_005514 [Xylographa carneopallida]|nr:hypothetical protein [Xylographa carneopallida]